MMEMCHFVSSVGFKQSMRKKRMKIEPKLLKYTIPDYTLEHH